MCIQSRNGLRPAIDLCAKFVAAVAARIGHDSTGGKNARAQQFSTSFVVSQPQYIIRYVAGIEDRGDAGIQVAMQRANALAPVIANRHQAFRSDLDTALQMYVHIHQAGYQEFARAINATRMFRCTDRAAGNLTDPVFVDQYRGPGHRRAPGAVDQSHVLDQQGIGRYSTGSSKCGSCSDGSDYSGEGPGMHIRKFLFSSSA